MNAPTKQCLTDNVLPRGFLANAIKIGKEQFLTSLHETKLLLFRLQNRDENLIPDLCTQQTTEVETQQIYFKYRTSASTVAQQESLWKMPLIGQEELRIRHSLSEGPHFVAPLMKHKRSGPSFPERITVGRALNQDLIIDHRSVSKIQAWFEIDDRGEFFLTDANSTNGTFINSQVIRPRHRIRLRPGDNIRFASVEAIFCRPEAFWQVVRPKDEPQQDSDH